MLDGLLLLGLVLEVLIIRHFLLLLSLSFDLSCFSSLVLVLFALSISLNTSCILLLLLTASLHLGLFDVKGLCLVLYFDVFEILSYFVLLLVFKLLLVLLLYGSLSTHFFELSFILDSLVEYIGVSFHI